MRPANQNGGIWPWRILMVEDNPEDQMMVRKCLNKQGIDCDFLVLTDGQQAIEFFETLEACSRERCPDIVLLDVGLPHHNGLEVLARIRAGERSGQVPVIIMTGSEAPNLFIEATKKAAKYVFLKRADYEGFLELGKILKDILGEISAKPSTSIKS